MIGDGLGDLFGVSEQFLCKEYSGISAVAILCIASRGFICVE